jgi:hypothetical protein
VYFDGHMHTVESDGSGTVADIKAEALSRGLSAVIVTNHAEMLTVEEWLGLYTQAAQLSTRDFLVINSFEITGSEGLFNRDHLLAWGVLDPFVGAPSAGLTPAEAWPSPPNPAGTGTTRPDNVARRAEWIHRQGGIAVHAHTTGSTSPAYGVDFIELFNMSHVKDVAAAARTIGMPADQAWGFGLTLNNMAVYGERDLGMMVQLPGAPAQMTLRSALRVATAQVLGGPEAPLHSWDDLLMGYVRGEVDSPTFGVADSDAHNTANVGAKASPDDSDVGEAKNGVFVKTMSPFGLIEAVKAGRCFATTGPSLRFSVNDKPMGETVAVRHGKDRQLRLALSADSERATSVLAQITIVRNGRIWRTLSPMTRSVRLDLLDGDLSAGYYRVEMVAVDGMDGQYRVAYSNPVFISASGPGGHLK